MGIKRKREEAARARGTHMPTNNECSGPCLEHCSSRRKSYRCGGGTAALAYLALGYMITSALYLCIARLTLGTPFADSLTDVQREAKARSKSERGRVFAVSVLAAASVLCVLRPIH